MIEINMNSMDGVVLMTAGKKIEENIKVTPVASLILPEYDGAYELLVPTVSGVWVFNESPTDSPFKQIVNFISYQDDPYEEYTTYISMELDSGGDILYTINESSTTSAYSIGEWGDDRYRTVDFGTEPQEVSEEFYAWLTANAVKQ